MIELDHINILATDLEAVRDFLLDVLDDLEEGFRPPFDFAGYWLYLDKKPVIHLKERGAWAVAGGGFVDHVAGAGLSLAGRDRRDELRRLAVVGGQDRRALVGDDPVELQHVVAERLDGVELRSGEVGAVVARDDHDRRDVVGVAEPVLELVHLGRLGRGGEEPGLVVLLHVGDRAERRTARRSPDHVLGLRPETLHGARLFVLPNPSGRNANFSYQEMLEAFKELAAYLTRRDAQR